MQPRKLLVFFLARKSHCWFMFNLFPTTTPKSFSIKLLSSPSAPRQSWYVGLFLPRCRTFRVALLNFMRFLSCQPISQPIEVHLDGSTPIRCISHCSWFCVIIIQAINEEVVWYWPQRTSSDWPLAGRCLIDDNPLNPAVQPVFSPLYCSLLVCNSTVF